MSGFLSFLASIAGHRREQTTLKQEFSRIADGCEGKAGTFCNVQQRVFSIRQIQYPEPGRDLGADGVAAGRPVEVPPAELWFAVRVPAAITLVIFKHVHDAGTYSKRTRQTERPDEIEVVRRGVIFRKG